MSKSCAYLVELFDMTSLGDLCKRRISLDFGSAEDWVYEFAGVLGYEVKERIVRSREVYEIYDSGTHVFRATVTNIALV